MPQLEAIRDAARELRSVTNPDAAECDAAMARGVTPDVATRCTGGPSDAARKLADGFQVAFEIGEGIRARGIV